jgi:hypothetical protein
MKRVFDQAAERDVYAELTIPPGEFVALLMAALMLLGLFFGSSTLPEIAKTMVADITATLSHASTSLESSMEARASEQQVRDIKESAVTFTWHPTRMSGHRHRHRGHHGHACLLCKVASNVKYSAR